MSAVTAYTSLIFDVLARVGGNVPEKQVERALRQAGREFCKESGAWHEELSVINKVANTRDYTLSHSYSTDALIERIMEANLDGVALQPADYEFIPTATFRFSVAKTPVADTDIDAYSGASTYAVGDKAQQSGVNYLCREAISTPESFDATKWTRIEDGLYVRVVFRPTYEATYLPAQFFDRWTDAFVEGAAARLLGMKGEPWYDPGAAREAGRLFTKHITDGKREGLLRYRSGDVTMIIPPGAY